MIIVMKSMISKSQLKGQILAHLRNVEKTKQTLIVTHNGKPVIKITPYKEVQVQDTLKNSVIQYKDPTHPVSEKDWGILK